MKKKTVHSSFRDPSGFLFKEEGKLLRQVNNCYQPDYEMLMNSGLYDELSKKGLLIPHREIPSHHGITEDAFRVIEPERVSFISYPYEWCFSQMKDAALLTLEIQRVALNYGMILKDATAYNVQFFRGRTVFIDTLSFEHYTEGSPWQAYRQFCQHFLAPLFLMRDKDIRLNQLLKIYLDGIPLDLASKLLPGRTWMNLSALLHLHLHAGAQTKYGNQGKAARKIRISKQGLSAMVQNLANIIEKLKLKSIRTEWGDYYASTNYSSHSFGRKREIISGFLHEIHPGRVWDLGANTGEFTELAANAGAECIAFDIDPLAVEYGYNLFWKQKKLNLLPLVMDITNPSPPIGWRNKERKGFSKRPLPDTVFALALLHHLAISNNLPFSRIAGFLRKLGEHLIIEFVPKSDSQVMRLLESRKDIFGNYDIETFLHEFGIFYDILAQEKVEDSERIIFLMRRK